MDKRVICNIRVYSWHWPARSNRELGMRKNNQVGQFTVRNRKVTICALVQPLLGLNVVADVPSVTPFSTAQATASA